jgi:tetratricopeptide (TPR) repeat protein
MQTPPSIGKELLIRLDELPPDVFERFALALSEVELHGKGRLYGLRGERQDGVDFVVRDHEGVLHVGQARRVQQLSAASIGAIVDQFLAGPWRHDAKSLILCTTASFKSTSTIIELERQKARLLRCGVRLLDWDRETVSSLLRVRPQIVELYFGPAWVEAYCLTHTGPRPLQLLTDGLVKVSDADWKTLGVQAASLHAPDGFSPKIERQVDHLAKSALDDAAHSNETRLVILRGEPAVGKTRTAFDAIRSSLSDWWLVAPDSAANVGACLDATAVAAAWSIPGPVVLWFEDLEQYAIPGTAMLTWLAIKNFRAKLSYPVIAIATLGGKGPWRLTDEQRRLIRVPLEIFLAQSDPVIIDVPRDLADDPVAQASVVSVLGEAAFKQVERVGLGSYLIAANRLVDKFVTGQHTVGHSVCVEGRTLAKVILDWHRAGIVAPVPMEIARRLWSLELRGIASTEPRWQRARDWVSEPIISTIALVWEQEDGTALAAHDYLVAWTELVETQSVELSIWRAILDLAPAHASELATRASELADSAASHEGLGEMGARELHYLERAIQAFDVAAGRGDVDAALNQGYIYQSLGRLGEALGAFWTAADSGSAYGQLELAHVMELFGAEQQALEYFLRAAHGFEWSPSAMEEAIHAYAKAAKLDPSVAGWELSNFIDDLESWSSLGVGVGVPWRSLAASLQEAGLSEAANRAYERALDEDAGLDWGIHVAYLACLRETGREEKIERYLRGYIETHSQSPVGEEAACELARFLLYAGRAGEARQVLFPFAAYDEREAARLLAGLLREEGSDRVAEVQLVWANARTYISPGGAC